AGRARTGVPSELRWAQRRCAGRGRSRRRGAERRWPAGPGDRPAAGAEVTTVPEQSEKPPGASVPGLHTEELKQQLRELLKVAGQRALGSVTSKLGDMGKNVGQKVVKKAAGPVREVGEKVASNVGPAGLVKAVGGGLTGGAKGVAEKATEAVTGDGGGGDGGGDFGKVTN